MKPAGQTWQAYLREGIHLMEGVHPDPHRNGRRWLPEAYSIFTECILQEDDLPVRAEAYFRMAQWEHYRENVAAAADWIRRGDDRISLDAEELPEAVHAQCRVLEGIVLKDLGRYADALRVTRQAASGMDIDDTVRGDAANRLARLYADHWIEIGYTEREALEYATLWFDTAVECFEYVIPPTPESTHALAAASGRAGIAHQRLDGYGSQTAHKHFRRADALFATDVREPCTHAAYWFNRARVAFRLRRPEAMWFFLRCLVPGFSCLWQKRRR